MFIWIWQIEKIVKKYGGIEKVIDKLKDLGILNVCIKFHEGSSQFGGGVNFTKDFLKYAPIFKANGFKVGTWGYNYFNYIYQESDMIIKALNNSDYYIFDPEVHVRGKFDQAEYVCNKVRKEHPEALIGYSTFPIVTYHRSIPYEIFDKYCDFASPQVYFGEMQWDVDKCMTKTLSDHQRFALNKPIIPSIQGHNQNKHIYNKFEKYEYTNFGVWSLDYIDSDFENWVKTLNNSAISSIKDKETKAKNPIIVGENDNKKTAKDVPSIKKLQKLFNIHNFTDENGNKLHVDGIPGPHTLAAAEKCIIQSSCKGEITKWIQNKLLSTGCKLKNYGADGVYGEEMKSAVLAFQRDNGLKADGIIGINTWEKLLIYKN